MNSVQIFGTQKSADTRKALRFFKERRVQIHLVDFKVRAPSRGELRRFVQKFGVEALLDREGRRFNDRGLHAASYSEDRWLEILEADPHLLRVPLVRAGARLSIGLAEEAWREWLDT